MAVKLKDFIDFISEGKFKVYAYYRDYTLYFRRSDGVVFAYRG